MILIFYAFAREIGPLRRKLRERAPLASRHVRGMRGKLGDREVALVAAGIGMSKARESARRALTHLPAPDFAVAIGVAGALSPGLAPGDIVLADRVMTCRPDGAEPEQVFAIDGVPRFSRALEAAGLAFSTGPILTVRRVLATADDKRRARAGSGAIAVDMESAALAMEAARAGVPFGCVRTVMDSADEEVVGAALADDQGRVRPLQAAALIIANPATLLRLPVMMRHLSLATRSLADATAAIVSTTL